MENYGNWMPIDLAVAWCKRNTVSYLLSVTPFEEWTRSDRIEILMHAIFTDMYDVALEIVENDSKLPTAKDETDEPSTIASLAIAKNEYGKRAFHYLAEKYGVIGRSSELSRCNTHFNFWFKRAHNKARMQTLVHQLVEELWRSIQELPKKQFRDLEPYLLDVVYIAVKSGNVGFLSIILHSYPDFIWIENKFKQNLFHLAILHRQESIVNLIYELSDDKEQLSITYDMNGNNILHFVGQLAPQERINTISGANFQLQRDLLWFKEIEEIIPPAHVKICNLESKIAYDLFEEEHEELRKKGEKQIKNTAHYCMIVATLMATMAFTANFTALSGHNQENRTSINLESNWFSIFFISNAIALLSSSRSIWLFLSIFTSQYRIEDFFKSLPTKLVLGLSMLFISIIGMILTFSAVYFLVYQNKVATILIVVIALVGVRIILFLRLHYDLWFDIIRKTYGSEFLFQPR